jgi:hypothetical protein
MRGINGVHKKPPARVRQVRRFWSVERRQRSFSPIGMRGIDYRLATRRLPFRKIGGRVLIPVAELRKYAQGDHPERIVAKSQTRVRIEPASRGAREAKPPLRAFAQRGALFAFLGYFRGFGLRWDRRRCLSGGAAGLHTATAFRCLPERFCLSTGCLPPARA